MTPRVAVVGGGYGGIVVAKLLDDAADVTLIEPRDRFIHNLAALRAVTDPDWIDRIFIPYDGLLTRGRVRRDRAVTVTPTTVQLASGEAVEADYIVLATGSTHHFPAKPEASDSTTAQAQLRQTYQELARADRVLLLGAGAVGLEFAGEIRTAWPDKDIMLIEPSAELMAGFPEEFRSQLRAQLEEMDIKVLLGASLQEPPATAAGQTGTFTVQTTTGVEITADIWFACYGATVVTDYLSPELQAARRPDGRIEVTPQLRVVGQERVFAVGDVTAIPEMKQAANASQHAEVVAANIRALIDGRDDLISHQPQPNQIALPLGPRGGVSYGPDFGVLGAAETAEIKGGLFLDRYLELLGATVEASQP